MAYFDPTRPAPFGALTVYRVVHVLDSLRMSYQDWRRARAAAKVLRQQADEQLDDMGFPRAYLGGLSRPIKRR